MRKLHLAFAFLALSLAGAAQAQAPGARQHDGFALQLDLGVGALASSSDFEGMDVAFSGPAGQFLLGAGYAVRENLILGAQVWSAAAKDPKLELDGEEAGDVDATLALTGIGANLTYYFMPVNIYVSATPSITVLSLETDGEKNETETGFGLRLAVGKEWFVSDNWGLGVSAQLALASNDDTEGSDVTWGSAWFGVGFSATFN